MGIQQRLQQQLVALPLLLQAAQAQRVQAGQHASGKPQLPGLAGIAQLRPLPIGWPCRLTCCSCHCCFCGLCTCICWLRCSSSLPAVLQQTPHHCQLAPLQRQCRRHLLPAIGLERAGPRRQQALHNWQVPIGCSRSSSKEQPAQQSSVRQSTACLQACLCVQPTPVAGISCLRVPPA